jgi:hypothetical protein
MKSNKGMHAQTLEHSAAQMVSPVPSVTLNISEHSTGLLLRLHCQSMVAGSPSHKQQLL